MAIEYILDRRHKSATILFSTSVLLLKLFFVIHSLVISFQLCVMVCPKVVVISYCVAMRSTINFIMHFIVFKLAVHFFYYNSIARNLEYSNILITHQRGPA